MPTQSAGGSVPTPRWSPPATTGAAERRPREGREGRKEATVHGSPRGDGSDGGGGGAARVDGDDGAPAVGDRNGEVDEVGEDAAKPKEAAPRMQIQICINEIHGFKLISYAPGMDQSEHHRRFAFAATDWCYRLHSWPIMPLLLSVYVFTDRSPRPPPTGVSACMAGLLCRRCWASTSSPTGCLVRRRLVNEDIPSIHSSPNEATLDIAGPITRSRAKQLEKEIHSQVNANLMLNNQITLNEPMLLSTCFNVLRNDGVHEQAWDDDGFCPPNICKEPGRA
uniref:HGWP repeat containing protein-like n=1 Tax=Oryza sativa subsp. japonica TaxID=39947 RepID=Q69TD7_ORYSJ|nr:HGWP repeat containing protein-like [Oryza sativa Japonica Group]